MPLIAKLSCLTIARLTGAFAMFVVTLVITRHFGATMTADFAVCLAAAGVMSVLLPFGFHAFAPILSAEYASRDDYAHLRGFVATGTRIVVTLSLVALLAAVATLWLAPQFVGEKRAFVAFTAVILAPLMALIQFNGGILSGLHKQVAAQLPDTLMRPLLVLAMLFALIVFSPEAALGWIVATLVIAAAAALCLQFLLLRKALSGKVAQTPKHDHARWRKMAPSWLSISLLWDYFIEIHLLLAAVIAAPVEIAMLHVCFRFRVLAGFGMRSIYAVCQPKIYAADAVGDTAAATRFISAANTLSLAYALATLAALWVLGPTLLALFDPAFVAASSMLLIVSCTFLVRALFGPAMAVLGMRGWHNRVAIVLAISLAVSVAVAALLYPVLGISAIAWAYTAANTLSAIALWWIARRNTGIDTAFWASAPGGGLSEILDRLRPAYPRS